MIASDHSDADMNLQKLFVYIDINPVPAICVVDGQKDLIECSVDVVLYVYF